MKELAPSYRNVFVSLDTYQRRLFIEMTKDERFQCKDLEDTQQRDCYVQFNKIEREKYVFLSSEEKEFTVSLPNSEDKKLFVVLDEERRTNFMKY